MRRSLLLAFVVLFASAFQRSAFADTITYTFVGDGNELTGSFTQDQNTQAVSGSFSYFDGTTTYTFAGSDIAGGGDASPNGNFIYNTFVNSAGDQFNLWVLNTSGPVNYLLCSFANPCTLSGSPAYSGVVPYGGESLEVVSNGVLNVSVGSTPEPSSIALLGTGILGISGVIRRKLMQA